MGYQIAAGFTIDLPATSTIPVVGVVTPASPAAASGLRAADKIVRVDSHPVRSLHDLESYLVEGWPRGKSDLTLTVERDGKEQEVGPFWPRTLGLHPTQLYESISMVLLYVLLTAYYPFRRNYGEVTALLMICYAVHRFLNESLRNDTPAVALGMTLSQNGSVFFFVAGLVLMLWLRRRASGAPAKLAMASS